MLALSASTEATRNKAAPAAPSRTPTTSRAIGPHTAWTLALRLTWIAKRQAPGRLSGRSVGRMPSSRLRRLNSRQARNHLPSRVTVRAARFSDIPALRELAFGFAEFWKRSPCMATLTVQR